MLKLQYMGDAILREKSEEIAVVDEKIKKLAREMLDSLDRFNGVGLSAVQVGFLYRLFVIDTRKKGERLVFINPEIIQSSEDRVPYDEGCLSLPGCFADVFRPSTVTVSAMDINGKKFVLTADGLLARAIQHENDHLNGKLFIDRLDDVKRAELQKEFEKNMKEKAQNQKKRKS